MHVCVRAHDNHPHAEDARMVGASSGMAGGTVSRPTVQRHGSASVSWGPKPYGGPKILANAPLSVEGFDDLIAVISQAKAEYERTR